MAILNGLCHRVLLFTILVSLFHSLRSTAQNHDVSQNTQDLVATWQGTLGNGQGLRFVIQINKGARGENRALFYSIDRSGDAIPGSAVSAGGSTLSMTFTMINATYSGRIAPDRNSIVGMWTQSSASAPLTLTRVTPGSEWAIPPTAKPTPMDPKVDPAFEVATVKPSNPEERRKFFRLSPDHFQGVNETVDDLITFSFGVHRKQIVDAPAWTESEKFDISAKPDAEGMPSLGQWKTMVQKLLADRFKLTFHRSESDLAVYILAAGPTGAKLTESLGDPSGLPGIGFQRRMGDLNAFNVTMADFINFMTRNAALDRPIVDRTGLAGRYDFRLNWTPDESQWTSVAPNVPRPTDDANAAPPLFTALQEQLGLKVSATKAPAEVYIIDRIEKPSAN